MIASSIFWLRCPSQVNLDEDSLLLVHRLFLNVWFNDNELFGRNKWTNHFYLLQVDIVNHSMWWKTTGEPFFFLVFNEKIWQRDVFVFLLNSEVSGSGSLGEGQLCVRLGHWFQTTSPCWSIKENQTSFSPHISHHEIMHKGKSFSVLNRC